MKIMNNDGVSSTILIDYISLPKDIINIISSYTKEYFDIEYYTGYNNVVSNIIYGDGPCFPLYILDKCNYHYIREDTYMGHSVAEFYADEFSTQVLYLNIFHYKMMNNDIKNIDLTLTMQDVNMKSAFGEKITRKIIGIGDKDRTCIGFYRIVKSTLDEKGYIEYRKDSCNSEDYPISDFTEENRVPRYRARHITIPKITFVDGTLIIDIIYI